MNARRQQGYSLIEIMISLLIGSVLIGSVLIAISGTGLSGRRQDGHARMAEDGQIVMNLLSGQVRQIGFFQPTSQVPSMHPPNDLLMIFGCRNGFSNPTVADFMGLICAGGVGNDSIALRYDAREPGYVPADCLGNTAVPNVGITAGWVDNRYYIANSASGNPALWCRGNGGGQPQVLVDNVESLQIRYGMSAARNFNTGQELNNPPLFDKATFVGETIRYVRADELVPACNRINAVNNSWCSVTNVRICVVMRTDPRASEVVGGTPFINCDGNTQTIGDSRLRRAITTTVSIRNRMR